MFTPQEIEFKKKELDDLAKSVDLWLATPMSEKKEKKVQKLFIELQEKMDEIDCQYLQLKLDAYHKIYETLKND